MKTPYGNTFLESASLNLILLQYLHFMLALGNDTSACVLVKVTIFSQHMLCTRHHNVLYLSVHVWMYLFFSIGNWTQAFLHALYPLRCLSGPVMFWVISLDTCFLKWVLLAALFPWARSNISKRHGWSNWLFILTC